LTRKPSIIVSGADAPYFGWLKDLWLSWKGTGADKTSDFGVLDLGLEPEQRAWLEERDVTLVTPDWPYENLEGTAPEWYKAMVCRPFVPEIFPGWDYVFWIDADSWFQDASVLDLFVQGATQDGFCVVPVVDRAYKPQFQGGRWFLNWQKSCIETGFGEETAESLYRFPIISAGAICGATAAPHWKVWQDYTELAVSRQAYREAEQTALCVMVHLGSMKAHFLPSWCHWVCNMAFPAIDLEQGLYVEPHLPHTPIGIIGMPGNTRSGSFDMPTLDGGFVHSTVGYGTAKKIARERQEAAGESPDNG